MTGRCECVFFCAAAASEIYTLSLHDALPILAGRSHRPARGRPLHRGCGGLLDRKSTRLNSSHVKISYAVFCLKKKTIVLIVLDFFSHAYHGEANAIALTIAPNFHLEFKE